MMAVAHMCAAIALCADVKADIPSPDGWGLVSETGVDGRFCGSRISEHYTTSGQIPMYADALMGYVGASYKIEFPMPDENNGNGTSEPGIAIPGGTP